MSINQDFRHLNDVVAKDIIKLQQKIVEYRTGKLDEDGFKHYRMMRGVYGQRQLGVQMLRTKIPYGKLNSDQLICLADISEKYTNGNLHLTTRQNIQMHYIKLEDTPAIWAEMSEKGITAREACGNTVRNLTASAKAGIDPDEPFDVSPYVQAAFEYFLRNPICQKMGRKIKPAFSSSEKDSAYTYFHDFGFIPKVKTEKGKEVRGFKVVIAGGLGAQSIVAQKAYDFLPEDQVIPFMEASIRVFDRYGERQKRFKARMKYLVKSIGVDGFLELVDKERKALKNQSYPIDYQSVDEVQPIHDKTPPLAKPSNKDKFEKWFETNVFEQKQKGFYGVQLKIHLGDIPAEKARKLAYLVKDYAADDIRITVNQGLLLRFVRKEALVSLFNELEKIGFADPGFNTIADITACPGTDTCNLAVTNSTGLSSRLEEVIVEEYPHLINESNIKIKISGCMNSCGQHMAANIGFHGSSIKKEQLVIPAMQIVLGGGVDPSGKGFIAEKVIKIPTKRIPDAFRMLLNDFEDNGLENEYFNDYFQRFGKRYFYDLLKQFADVSTLEGNDHFDWGMDSEYKQAIGIGECAGVIIDVVGTIIAEASDKINLAKEAISKKIYADGIYHAYSAMVIGAKALLLAKDVKCNTQIGVINDFETHYISTKEFLLDQDFAELVLQINQNEPSDAFAQNYLKQAIDFVKKVIALREKQLNGDDDKEIIDEYYKA